jgi:hypothetical protein
MDETIVFSRLELKGMTSNAGNTGWLGVRGNQTNARALDTVEFPFMVCPSSDVDRTVTLDDATADITTTIVALPQYVGIAGSVRHETARPVETIDGFQGKVSLGGALVVGKRISLRMVTDGTAKTLLIGEQADWCQRDDGTPTLCESSCLHGFLMGPRIVDSSRQFNLTALAHAVGDKQWTAEGVAGNCGPNRAIQSPHSGGAFVGLVDGSVHFLAEATDLEILFALADRDDGRSASVRR